VQCVAIVIFLFSRISLFAFVCVCIVVMCALDVLLMKVFKINWLLHAVSCFWTENGHEPGRRHISRGIHGDLHQGIVWHATFRS